MGILDGNPKEEPMHFGEIFNVWSFSTKAKLFLATCQSFVNHAGDKDLKQLVRDIIEQTKQEIRQCDDLLTANGIAPSPMLPEKPSANLEDIPAGARFADPEIAAVISGNTAMGLTECSMIMGTAIREDISAMFGKFHADKTALSARLLKLNKAKGWLVPPPLQMKHRELVEA